MYNTTTFLVSLETRQHHLDHHGHSTPCSFSRFVERHLPHSDGGIRTRPSQLPLSDPEDAIDAARNGVHDSDFLRRFPDAPHVYVSVQRPGSTMQRVRGPAERVHSGGVEGPAVGDHLALRHVVQYDLAAGLMGKRDKCGGKRSIKNKIKKNSAAAAVTQDGVYVVRRAALRGCRR
jgi:hypothetical protein